MVIFLRTFRRRGISVPTYKPATTLVTDGPYRFSRNPGYISMFLIYAGIVLAADCVWLLGLLVLFVVVIHYGVVRREEHNFEHRFGEEYRRYKSAVRRWI